MYRALAYKEWRETWWLGGIAFLILSAHVYSAVGLTFQFDRFAWEWQVVRTTVPFSTGELDELVAYTACTLGVALGLWQTLGESLRGTWRFLRHRPMSFPAIVLTKIVAGLGLLLVATALPILFYAIWAATPGTHASPFQWSMSVPTWRNWFVSSTAYLAAFLIGLRDVRWYGSRLWPAVIPVVWIFWTYLSVSFTSVLPTLAINGILLGAILHAAAERDE
jgi:hypothetical protein